MQIILNGEATEIPDGSTALSLLEAQGWAGKRVAIEINLEIVPRSAQAETRLNPGDRVEIVQAVGGG